MRKVLLAVNGSEHSDQAARYVVEFVKEHGATEIHLSHWQRIRQMSDFSVDQLHEATKAPTDQ